MKNLFKTALFATGLFIAAQSHAQTHKDTTVGQKIGTTAKNVGHATSSAAKDVGHATSTTAKKVGHKTSEVAAKGAAAVADKKYEGKAAPGGQTIYIDKNSAYYYINKKGHKVYVPKAELIDKAED